jgi:hypothetical protein
MRAVRPDGPEELARAASGGAFGPASLGRGIRGGIGSVRSLRGIARGGSERSEGSGRIIGSGVKFGSYRGCDDPAAARWEGGACRRIRYARRARLRFRHRRFAVLERIGMRNFAVRPSSIGGETGQLRSGGRTGAPGRAAARPNDIGFDDKISRATDHQKMFDIVAPDQHQPAAAIDCGGIDHRKPGHPSAIGARAEIASAEPSNQPGGEPDQRKYDDEGKKNQSVCDMSCPRQTSSASMPDSQVNRRETSGLARIGGEV